MDGMNVLDFYSPDVGQRLAELEAEEAERLRQLEALNSQEEDVCFAFVFLVVFMWVTACFLLVSNIICRFNGESEED